MDPTEPKPTRHFARLKTEDPDGLKAIAAMGGLTTTARHGRDHNMGKARAQMRANILAQVDPDGTLSPEELAIRVKNIYRIRALKARERKRQKQRAAELAAQQAEGIADGAA